MWNEPTKEQLTKLPRLYETENKPLKDKPIYLHFFIGDCDWFISEYDGEDLFFGYAILGDSRFGEWGYISFSNPIFAEWGYISFEELKSIKIPPGIEVDCEFFNEPWKASEFDKIRTMKARRFHLFIFTIRLPRKVTICVRNMSNIDTERVYRLGSFKERIETRGRRSTLHESRGAFKILGNGIK